MKILTIIGTRPEAIKMAPIIKKLESYNSVTSLVCVTAQHREMLDQVLSIFKITPDFDLNLMSSNQTLTGIFSKIMLQLEPILQEVKPDVVLVHGDTLTTFASTMSAFYANIPVVHIEAGLRTYNLKSPWPEEAHRQLTGRIATLHFTPSQYTAQNLYGEHVNPDSIFIVGNTVIDALLMAKKTIEEDIELQASIAKKFEFLKEDRRLVLITTHRRENFGDGLMSIIEGIKRLASNYPEVDFVIPVHLNPKVNEPIHKYLQDVKNIFLIEPQEYLPFVWLMARSSIILTDSGGIQEEAPSLDVPVLVMRDTTERQEALKVGTIKLIGTHTETLVSEVSLLLDNPDVCKKMAETANPYGDGNSSQLIIDNMLEFFSKNKF